MRVLITGADGFVGSWLVPAASAAGLDVVATVRAGARQVPPWLRDLDTVPFELLDAASVRAAARLGCELVVHLAGIASGVEAWADPERAREVNARGTAWLAEALGGGRLLVVSTAEVYGAGPHRPRTEEDPTAPVSPYASSKLAAERAALEVGERTGLEVIVARSFPHTGRGQDNRFVVPAFARRLLDAKRTGATTVPVGNLSPVRDFLHVSDVVRAYLALLEQGTPGKVYNVAAGRSVSIRQVFEQLARLVGTDAVPVVDPSRARANEIPYLVGDARKLADATSWKPEVEFEDALAEVLDAQAD